MPTYSHCCSFFITITHYCYSYFRGFWFVWVTRIAFPDMSKNKLALFLFDRLSLICCCNGARLRYDQGYTKFLFIFVVFVICLTTMMMLHLGNNRELSVHTAEFGESVIYCHNYLDMYRWWHFIITTKYKVLLILCRNRVRVAIYPHAIADFNSLLGKICIPFCLKYSTLTFLPKLYFIRKSLLALFFT